MVRKTLALAAVLLFVTVGAAQAQTYPPGANTITASDTSVTPGQAVVLGIQVCRPAATATFDLDAATRLASATANSSGVASATVTIPASTTAGTHTIQGECTAPNGTQLVQVLSITVTGGTGLPVTGASNTTPMTQIAIGAIAAGGLLVLVAKRRHDNKADAREAAGV